MTFQIGTAIANMLPNRIGLDKLQFNYTQSVLGLITAATGINYEPCIISAGAAGAVLGGHPMCSSCASTDEVPAAACGLPLMQRQLDLDSEIVKRQTASQQSSMRMQLRLPFPLLEKYARASIRTALCLCSCHGDWNQP